jgi:anti-anti-sigma factor
MAIDISKTSDSSFALSGKLEFASVRQAEKTAKSLFNFQQDFTIDCTELKHCDSAGIALLVNWTKFAKLNEVKILFINFTRQMQQLINLMNLEGIFPGKQSGK